MEQDTHQLIQDTVSCVEEYWNENKQPLLLSALGSLKDGRISQDARLHAGGLRPFLENFIGNRLQLVQHSTNRTIVGVVPINENTQMVENWDTLLERPSSKSSRVRLNPTFWAAFRNPIDNTLERYFQISDSIDFVDVKSGEAPEGGIHVEREYIACLGTHPEEIYENAMRWIKKNDLNVSDFIRKASSTSGNRLPSNDLLGKLILALDAQELKRTSIPMDVVAKLRRQSV